MFGFENKDVRIITIKAWVWLSLDMTFSFNRLTKLNETIRTGISGFEIISLKGE